MATPPSSRPSAPSTSSTSATSATLRTASAPSAAEAALDFVQDGMKLGLGTGRAAAAFVEALGARVAQGLRVTGVPTSEATAALARRLSIPLARLDEVPRLDVTFDGADEVDPKLDVIKGYGAAMVREKIVARSSERLVILVGPEKLVKQLGERGRLPIEVLPFGRALVERELARLGLASAVRLAANGEPVVTDNGNLVLDAELRPPLDARGLEQAICTLPGVLGTGFFLDMADAVIVGSDDAVELRRRPGRG
ncbi:MAG: ribose-5-phosphate isomerase RpiA [Deltaproteobacteria bacterium]|nr:ribose-5-phosphate isomerase RpiA [Deltaproteobacteria bacterium]